MLARRELLFCVRRALAHPQHYYRCRKNYRMCQGDKIHRVPQRNRPTTIFRHGRRDHRPKTRPPPPRSFPKNSPLQTTPQSLVRRILLLHSLQNQQRLLALRILPRQQYPKIRLNQKEHRTYDLRWRVLDPTQNNINCFWK